MRPTTVTRVTDSIELIKEYIGKFETNGYTYVNEGSVYFDSQKFIKDGFDFYPLTCGSSSEKIFSDCEYSNDKKHNSDFALWQVVFWVN